MTRAVDEALTNIMRHTYGGQLDRPIELLCHRVPKRPGNAGGEGFEVLLDRPRARGGSGEIEEGGGWMRSSQAGWGYISSGKAWTSWNSSASKGRTCCG